MNSQKNQNITIKIHDLKNLFIAPKQNPLSNYECIRSGEAALPRAIRFHDVMGTWDHVKLIIQLPYNKIESMKVDTIHDSLHQYLKGLLEENQFNLFIFRRNAIRIFRNAFLFLAFCMALITIIGNETFLPNMPPFLRTVLVEGFTVVGWVVLWRPLELVLNELGPMKRKKMICQKLLVAPIVIVPA